MQPKKKNNNNSKFMQTQTFMKEEKNKEGEEKKMKTTSALQRAKRKEKGIRRLQAFQHKKRAEALAIGMVARNEALDQLGLKVNEEEIMSEHFLAFSAPLIIWVSISLAVARKPGRPPTGRTPSEGGRDARRLKPPPHCDILLGF